jgi:hypothetical protein
MVVVWTDFSTQVSVSEKIYILTSSLALAIGYSYFVFDPRPFMFSAIVLPISMNICPLSLNIADKTLPAAAARADDFLAASAAILLLEVLISADVIVASALMLPSASCYVPHYC